MSSSHDCGADVAAYVLGALEADEAQAFERHLESCTVCRDEVAALRPVVQALPMSAPQRPVPKHLRRRVLEAARQDARATAAPARPRERVARRRWRAAGAALAGACAVAAIALAFALSGSNARRVRVIQAHVTGIAGSAALRLSGGHGELIVRRLSPPPPGDIYELWLKRADSAPAPTNVLFGVTSSGAGEIGLPAQLHGATEILVTPEPRGGTRVPTHAPVIVAPLT